MYDTDQVKYTCVFWVRSTDQLKKYVIGYVSWSNTHFHAYVARATWSCTYLFSTCYGCLLVTQCMLKSGSMIVQLWWWKTTPIMVTPSLLTNHRSQQTTAINTFYKASPFFWVALISSRDRLPQARCAGAIYHCVVASDSWVPLGRLL